MYRAIQNKLEQINDLSPGLLPYCDRLIVDKECSGLRFVALNDGKGGRWVRRFKDKKGRMKQYTFGKYPEVSVQDARAYIDSVRGEKRNNYLTNPDHRIPNSLS